MKSGNFMTSRSLECFFHSDFRTKILYAFPIPPMGAIFPANPIVLDLISLIVFGEEYKVCNSLCSYLSVTDQVSHPYKARTKCITLYISIFKSVERRLEGNKRF